MNKAKKERIKLVAQHWYKPGKRGETARALLSEHPEYFENV